jgi:hypothetical protein
VAHATDGLDVFDNAGRSRPLDGRLLGGRIHETASLSDQNGDDGPGAASGQRVGNSSRFMFNITIAGF